MFCYAIIFISYTRMKLFPAIVTLGRFIYMRRLNRALYSLTEQSSKYFYTVKSLVVSISDEKLVDASIVPCND